MDLEQHLDRLGALLDRERAAEKERFAPLPFAERLRRGLARTAEAAGAGSGLAERAEDLMLVHGRPGTGKTTVLVELIRRAAARGEKVLASAPSNLAVDNLVERLVAAGIDVVRVGHPARVLPAVVDHTLDQKTKAHPQAQIAAELVDQAIRLRADARKRTQRRGPGRFSEARGQEREARQLLSEARELEDRAERDVLER